MKIYGTTIIAKITYIDMENNIIHIKPEDRSEIFNRCKLIQGMISKHKLKNGDYAIIKTSESHNYKVFFNNEIIGDPIVEPLTG